MSPPSSVQPHLNPKKLYWIFHCLFMYTVCMTDYQTWHLLQILVMPILSLPKRFNAFLNSRTIIQDETVSRPDMSAHSSVARPSSHQRPVHLAYGICGVCQWYLGVSLSCVLSPISFVSLSPRLVPGGRSRRFNALWFIVMLTALLPDHTL